LEVDQHCQLGTLNRRSSTKKVRVTINYDKYYLNLTLIHNCFSGKYTQIRPGRNLFIVISS